MPVVTYSLIVTNVLIFILVKAKVFDYVDLGNCYTMVHDYGQKARLFTCAFTHSHFFHIFFNMISLHNLGSILEPVLGSVTFVLIYISAIFVSSIFSEKYHFRKGNPQTISIGASGAICALLGMTCVLLFKSGGISSFTSILRSIIPLVLMGFSPVIDSAGHFSGLALGILLGIFIL